MKHILFSLTLFCLAALLAQSGHSQAAMLALPHQIAAEAGENAEPLQDELSLAERQALDENIQSGLRRLQEAGLAAPNTTQAVLYDWPVRLAPGLTDYAGFYVSAFSDHNSASSAFFDYNNGTRTYDTHRGTDIALWPFNWNKVDAGDVQVVAAADGTLLNREEKTPVDHNCGSSSDPTLGNYIVLLHADGRITIYGHMKYNSLTAKSVGQSVVKGEYLGTVGSSGNSSGPHVHFEVRSSANGGNTSWLDPFTGPGNPIPSSWNSQPAYYDSAINKIATSTAFPVSTNCQPTVTNIQDSFSTAPHIAFQVHYRAYQGLLPTVLTIYDPTSAVYETWSYTDNATPFASAASRYWSRDFPASVPSGTWRFEAVYNGQTYQTLFTINASPVNYTNAVYLPLVIR
jgi:murein DD-endopeptidase MepM/ murein hydrolase activator NlpD